MKSRAFSFFQAFLEAVSGVAEELSSAGKPPASPWALVLVGLAADVEASYASGPATPAMAIALGAVLAATSRKLRGWLTVTLVSAFFAGLVALPALLRGDPGAPLFVLRAVAASSAFTGVLASLGWLWLLRGLEELRLPRGLVWELGLTLRAIPVFARDASRMLAAREARLLASSRASWSVVSSVAGDLLLAGVRRARALQMALEARSFGEPLAPRRRLDPRPADAALIAWALLMTAVFAGGA
ncbi:CbiQ family ECF transporter T component [Thermofilum pendens]|uniref:Cobalt transport protein n=1 Tax=Thermofilum pendens (strain DSM 2475 / Hrk 5) TaxID=368408 RepID=A1S106_THEPD|nr:energy-coupling factor transporter transmembrane component T [Thermofilum pendens]ABL79136.1 cobalt transport protein [Thermofilum pendens Hrk 5]